MASKETVVVAMSGGVDSSVAAALLKEQGYDVIGVTLQIWQEPDDATKGSGCCSLGAVEDARRVAAKIGIPHYCLNYREYFAEKVISDFVDEYTRGRTPNPCINCNRFVKFDALLSHARQLGAEFLATGHYAQIGYDEDRGRWLLRKAVDRAKDQTYALSYFTQDQLSRTLMPLGSLTDKAHVRKLAENLGLAVANKPDSQEICFTHGRSYTEYLARVAPSTVQSGEIVDTTGRVLGRHDGIAFYTIGQRKRINVGSPVPLFVVNIDADDNRVTVGSEEELASTCLQADDVNWVSALEAGRLSAKIRYNMSAVPCAAYSHHGSLFVRFDQPQRAVTPGQALVLYDDDVVVAGATIRCTVPDLPLELEQSLSASSKGAGIEPNN